MQVVSSIPEAPPPPPRPGPGSVSSAESPADRRDHGQWAGALIDQVEWGLALCSAEGRLIYANRAAWREFDDGSSLAVVLGTVSDGKESQAELRHAIHEAATRQRTRLLVVGPKENELPIVVLPLRVDEFDAPAALVMMGRRALCSPLGLEMLASRHGLTFSEQRVLRALIANRSARQIANVNCVSICTVRTQIQSIRDKVGVKSIDALLVRAGQVPPVGSWYESQND